MNPEMMAMMTSILPFLKHTGPMAGPGTPGVTPTPGMQQAAAANGAVTPQDAANSTIAGVEPGAPAAGSFDHNNNAMMMKLLASGALAGLTNKSANPPAAHAPQMAPSFHGSGSGPAPIGMPPMRASLPMQRPAAAPMAAGASMLTPEVLALVKQLQQLNAATGLN